MGWVLDEYLDEEGLTYGRGPTGLITGCVRPWRASEHPLDKPVDAPACCKPFLVKARESPPPMQRGRHLQRHRPRVAVNCLSANQHVCLAQPVLLVRLGRLARDAYAYIRLMKRMRTVATSARAAPSVGLSSPVTSSPVNRPLATAQDMASLA